MIVDLSVDQHFFPASITHYIVGDPAFNLIARLVMLPLVIVSYLLWSAQAAYPERGLILNRSN